MHAHCMFLSHVLVRVGGALSQGEKDDVSFGILFLFIIQATSSKFYIHVV